jgi:hypothetical protein
VVVHQTYASAPGLRADSATLSTISPGFLYVCLAWKHFSDLTRRRAVWATYQAVPSTRDLRPRRFIMYLIWVFHRMAAGILVLLL